MSGTSCVRRGELVSAGPTFPLNPKQPKRGRIIQKLWRPLQHFASRDAKGLVSVSAVGNGEDVAASALPLDASTAEDARTVGVQLPVETWWEIIDCLQQDWSALLVCTIVCQAWHVRAQAHLPKGNGHAVGLLSRQDVILLSQCSRARALHTRAVHVYGDRHTGSLAHLGTFAAMLSGKLHRLEELQILDCTWKTAALKETILLRRLSEFTSIRTLRLQNVILPSATTIANLLRALPDLRSLKCASVSTTKKQYGDAAILDALLRPLMDLQRLDLDCPDGDDIIHLFASTTLAQYARTAVIAVYTRPDRKGTRTTNDQRLIHRLTSISQLSITFHDTGRSPESIRSFLTQALQHCAARLETLVVKVTRHADPEMELPTLCCIPSAVTGHTRSSTVSVTLGPRTQSEEKHSIEEVVRVRFTDSHTTALVRFSIPSWVSRAPGFREDAWLEQLKDCAAEGHAESYVKTMRTARFAVIGGHSRYPRNPFYFSISFHVPSILSNPVWTMRSIANAGVVMPKRLKSTLIRSRMDWDGPRWPTDSDLEPSRPHFHMATFRGTRTYVFAVEKP